MTLGGWRELPQLAAFVIAGCWNMCCTCCNSATVCVVLLVDFFCAACAALGWVTCWSCPIPRCQIQVVSSLGWVPPGESLCVKWDWCYETKGSGSPRCTTPLVHRCTTSLVFAAGPCAVRVRVRCLAGNAQSCSTGQAASQTAFGVLWFVQGNHFTRPPCKTQHTLEGA